MTRRKFTLKFKTKVVLEALKEWETVKDLAQRFEISPQQINLWKREFLQMGLWAMLSKNGVLYDVKGILKERVNARL